MEIILCIFLLVVFVLSVIINRGDFFRPGIIVSAVMLLASFCAAYLGPIWKFKLNLYTIIIIVVSVCTVVFTDYCSTILYSPYPVKCISLRKIIVNNYLLFGVVVFDLITLIWHFRYLISTTGMLSSISMMVTQYRKSVVYGTLDSSVPGMLARFIRISKDFSYIFLYVYINNVLITKQFINNMKYLIPPVIFCCDSLLWGARGYIMYMFFAGVTYIFILYQKSNGWKNKGGWKLIKKIAKYAVLACIMFVLLGSYTGRSVTKSLFYRLALYFGGGIPLLNEFLKNAEKSAFPGTATFYSLFRFLSRRCGLEMEKTYAQFEFRYGNGYSWGNVYTALRRYYMDFGMHGVIILSAVLAIFFGFFYSYIRRKKQSNQNVDGAVIVYGIMVRSLVLFFFDDRLYMDFVTPSIVVLSIELFACIYLINGVGIGRNGLKIRMPFFLSRKKYNLSRRVDAIVND